MTTKKTNWLTSFAIILSFMLVFLPAQVAIPQLQQIIVLITGGLSIAVQIILLVGESAKGKKLSSFVLLGLTVIAMVLMFIVYK
ncbi:MAG: hypothetical protein NXI00_18560 [Cytophagales bacterium]|nr:hypothetical protein [Cytophagales bacterium]